MRLHPAGHAVRLKGYIIKPTVKYYREKRIDLVRITRKKNTPNKLITTITAPAPRGSLNTFCVKRRFVCIHTCVCLCVYSIESMLHTNVGRRRTDLKVTQSVFSIYRLHDDGAVSESSGKKRDDLFPFVCLLSFQILQLSDMFVICITILLCWWLILFSTIVLGWLK
jgi:hypothetical protein